MFGGLWFKRLVLFPLLFICGAKGYEQKKTGLTIAVIQEQIINILYCLQDISSLWSNILFKTRRVDADIVRTGRVGDGDGVVARIGDAACKAQEAVRPRLVDLTAITVAALVFAGRCCFIPSCQILGQIECAPASGVEIGFQIGAFCGDSSFGYCGYGV